MKSESAARQRGQAHGTANQEPQAGLRKSIVAKSSKLGD